MLFLNENKKKRNYYTRIMEVDQTGGGIGEEGRAFFSWLAILLLLKNGIEKSSDILDTIQRKFCTTQKFVVVFKRLPTSIKNNWWKLLYKQYIWLFLDSGRLSL